jgi:hypothetical protein
MIFKKYVNIWLDERERREARRAVNAHYGLPLTIPNGTVIPDELKEAHYRLCMSYEEPVQVELDPKTGHLELKRVVVDD